ncbi:hypothetical protein F511_15712 [Dorcoceras hygrometricum]|uniref:Uncharacterized protein n=1 Tax=Dorcoceras hygrometricum TaxID=472368 RepID=A0A2Z7BD96_9LAMI|nr:hypothetical protein F511_15712 [Dorcoceras hygrometricum]
MGSNPSTESNNTTEITARNKMQVLCMRRQGTMESSTHKGAKELKHSSKNQQREALCCFVLATEYPAAGVISCATSFELLPESSGFLAGLVVAQYKDVRASSNTALSSPCWDRSHHAPSG